MKGFIMPGSEVIVTFTDWLINATVDISFCVLLILLVRRFFARFFGARLSRILWVVLFIRCIVPWSFPIDIYPTSVLTEFRTALEQKPTVSTPIQPVKEVTVSPEVKSNAGTTPQIQVASPRRKIFTKETIRIASVGLWFSGMVLLLGLTIFRNRKVAHRATETPKPIPSWLQEIFLESRERLKLKTWPVLIVSSDIDSPCLIGAIRPRILLPYHLVSRANKQQLTHILMHELAHIKQGDIWLSWFWTVICSIQWFNPLVWLSGRYMYLDREMACDERVLRMLESQSRIEYSHSLLDLFKKVNLPARCPGLACVVERKTNIERRLGMITKFKIRSNRQILLGSLTLLIVAAISLTSFAGANQAAKLSSEKAELMGRVEDFFMHNFRDVTARKSLEWKMSETDEKGNRTIRYMYEAQIWEKEWKIMNQVFTFDKDGGFVGYKNVTGFPKDKEVVKVDTSKEDGIKALVEKFFTQNYRDLTDRKTIEWGKANTEENSNRSIRYKYEASSWGINKQIHNQKFIFKPDGEFVSVEDLDIITSSNLAEPVESDFRVYKVGKKVSDYPKQNNLSTPEASYATIMRNYMATGASGSEWSEISLKEIPGTERRDISKEKAESYINARIVEVRIYKESLARVLAEIDDNGTKGYDQRSLFLRDGQWLNLGHDGTAPTLEEAREIFSRKCARILNSNLAIVRE
ncbi:MAG: hypothetical protein JXA96_04130 [Sedimentisphaerales bacterium]|nr:hypothetical protein [Sedimentisphaerales bacterium]